MVDLDLLTWRLEGLICSVDGDPAHAPLEVELDVVPLAVVERQAGGAHVDGPRPQVEVHVQVALQQLHREVVLEGRKEQRPEMLFPRKKGENKTQPSAAQVSLFHIPRGSNAVSQPELLLGGLE